jgi:UDP-GlcNAc:undecaprenyl-phosphate GlcNAc-1-phosphate transferase
MNLIDGLDGLASGIAFIITATMLCISLSNGNETLAVMSAILCGSALGFLRYNFNPARIFMGDSGSMFLGFTLAVLSLQGTQKSTTAVAIFIPILSFGLPIADTALALWRRLFPRIQSGARSGGWRVFEADRQHIHHRLMDVGFSHRTAVLILYVVTGVLSTLAFLLTAARSETAAWVLAVTLVVTLGLVLVLASSSPRVRGTGSQAGGKP